MAYVLPLPVCKSIMIINVEWNDGVVLNEWVVGNEGEKIERIFLLFVLILLE